MQSLKLGTIAPWDHDFDLSIAFNDCGGKYSAKTGMGSDVHLGCQHFLLSIENIVKHFILLQKTTEIEWIPDGYGEKRWFINSKNKGFAQIRMTMPFYFRDSAWGKICKRTEDYQLLESWSSCLNKQRIESNSIINYKKSKWIQMDLHNKPGIKPSNIQKQLYIDLIGPPGSVRKLGQTYKVDELRVGLHYNKLNRELWFMEFIDIQYGSSWLEHPWYCKWKYELTFS
jgi:hypothetical protein